MKSEVLIHVANPLLVCTGMFIFISVFVGALVLMFQKNRTLIYRHVAHLPLSDCEELQ